MTWRARAIALVAAILGVMLLLLYQRRFEMEVSGGPRVRVLATVKKVPRGTLLTAEMLTVHEVPLAYFEDRMIAETGRPKILGLRVGSTVGAQQTLQWTDLVAASDERRDLSALIQPGSRAVSIHAGRDDSQLAMIRPGDYVDVVSTFSGPNETRSAAVLLQKVIVLAAGSGTEPRETKERGEHVLTLSVTVPEVQLLALALEKGHLTVALRNPDDPKTADRLPDLVSTAFADAKERGQIKGIRGPTRLEGGGE